MKKNLTYKILSDHLLSGSLSAGEEITIKVDQTLTQDTTGTMAYLQLEALNPTSKKTELSVAYVDHNTLQLGFENADDHVYIKSVCQKYGLIYSKAGSGICHQLHLESFAKPGKTLIGSDSHTPTAGAMASLAIGSGGLDIALAIGHGNYSMTCPKVMAVYLEGHLNKGSSAKDIILQLLRLLSVKGGVGYVLEYIGPGVETLSLHQRATITNMGAELGATTSIFPSDQITKNYLKAHEREKDFTALSGDPDAYYDEKIFLNLSDISPLVACPHSPDNVKDIHQLDNITVNQVAIGSCTNGSFEDLIQVANILKDKTIHPNVDLVVSPGSASILNQLTQVGALSDLIQAGARILEPACGPCIGMGQAPQSEGVSVRTFNRNFKGRCGTSSANVYLVSPESAAVTALNGYITCIEDQEIVNHYCFTDKKLLKQNFINYDGDRDFKTIKGPNIKSVPESIEFEDETYGKVLLKAKDNITTDDIVPSNAKILPLRSNIPELSKYTFSLLDPNFYEKALENSGGFIVAGENYGQGSSREHAALAPLSLKVKAVLAKSYGRIHKKNLINAGIRPFTFKNKEDYDSIHELDSYVIRKNSNQYFIESETKDCYEILLDVGPKELAILNAGGALNYKEVL